jgi:type IV pilus assembly protein PilW
MVLVADRQAAGDGSRRPCMVEQVSGGFAAGAGNTLALSGDYHAAAIGGTSLSGYSSSAVAIDLGNPSGRAPSFMLVGVGDNDVLYSYDLLQASGTPLQAQAEGVFELHALYGVDADGDGKVDAWVSPATGNYSLAALSAGNATAASRLAQIKAVRIGLILRTSLAEKTAVTTSALALFSDLGDLAYSRALAGDEQHYRYRTMETIVPVRNNLLVSP